MAFCVVFAKPYVFHPKPLRSEGRAFISAICSPLWMRQGTEKPEVPISAGYGSGAVFPRRGFYDDGGLIVNEDFQLEWIKRSMGTQASKLGRPLGCL